MGHHLRQTDLHERMYLRRIQHKYGYRRERQRAGHRAETTTGHIPPTATPTPTPTPIEVVSVDLGTVTIAGIVYDSVGGSGAALADARVTYELGSLSGNQLW